MYIPEYEPFSRFLAHLEDAKLESGESNEDFLKREYERWHGYYSKRFEEYDKSLRLDMAHRKMVEKAVDNLVEVLRDAGISVGAHFSDGKDHGYDLEQIHLKFEGDGSGILRGIDVCTKDSCYSALLFALTDDEIHSLAMHQAESSLESEIYMQDYRRKEKEREEAERKAFAEHERKFYEEWVKWRKDHPDEDYCPYSSGVYCSPDAYFKTMEEKVKPAEPAEPDEPQEPEKPAFEDTISEPTKFAKKIVEDLLAAERGEKSDYLKLYDSLDNEGQAVIDRYVDVCLEFSEAMNEGLTGLCLYPFNERRANAHESMLEAFGLENDYAARSATKDFDFTDTYDYKTGKYRHRPYADAENYLAYALVKCRQHMLQGQMGHAGTPAAIEHMIREP